MPTKKSKKGCPRPPKPKSGAIAKTGVKAKAGSAVERLALREPVARHSKNYTYLPVLPLQSVPVRGLKEKRGKPYINLHMGEMLRRNVIHILRSKGFRTFEQFSYHAGFSKSTLSQITRERRDPRLSTLEKLAHVLEVPLHRLFTPPFPLPADWDEL